MNVFDFAMNMEQDGETYYRELAQSTDNKGLATILTFLAKEEALHYNIFKGMKERKGESLPSTNLLDNVKNVFIEMKEKGDNFTFEAKQIEYYRKAQELERKSEDFYREKAEETTSIHERKLLNSIADEEKRHFFVLEEIIDFLRRPQEWLENAEWNHLDNY